MKRSDFVKELQKELENVDLSKYNKKDVADKFLQLVENLGMEPPFYEHLDHYCIGWEDE